MPTGPLLQQLTRLRPQLAAAVTEVLQEWQQDEDGIDGTLGEGGVCDLVAQALSGVVAQHLADVELTAGGQDGDDHAFMVARLGAEVYGVDVDPDLYEQGEGYSWRKTADSVGPADIDFFETWWPDSLAEGKMHPIYDLITDGLVTAADFNLLITETSMKSTRERIRRVTEPIDHNRLHTSDGHSRTAPNLAARAVKRKGGGALNDPRRTARGRTMLKRQETSNEGKPWPTDADPALVAAWESEGNVHIPFPADGSKPSVYSEAVTFVRNHNNQQYDLSTVQNQPALQRLVTRLLREQTQLNHDWLFELHQRLAAQPTV